jgi:hypothetical protein
VALYPQLPCWYCKQHTQYQVVSTVDTQTYLQSLLQVICGVQLAINNFQQLLWLLTAQCPTATTIGTVTTVAHHSRPHGTARCNAMPQHTTHTQNRTSPNALRLLTHLFPPHTPHSLWLHPPAFWQLRLPEVLWQYAQTTPRKPQATPNHTTPQPLTHSGSTPMPSGSSGSRKSWRCTPMMRLYVASSSSPNSTWTQITNKNGCL